MFSFQKLLKVVLVAVACSSASLAAPWPTDAKHETHRVHLVRRSDAALQIQTFAPASTFEVRLTSMMLDGSSVEISLLSRLSVRTVVATSRKARRLPPPGCLESIRVLKAFHQRG